MSCGIIFRWTDAGPTEVDVIDDLEEANHATQAGAHKPGRDPIGGVPEAPGLTQRRLADHLGCDVKVINRFVNGQTGVTPEMALKLGAAVETSPEFLLNAQKVVDLYRAAEALGTLPGSLLRAS